MESVKTFVQEDLTATVACPVCRKAKTVSVAAYKDRNHIIRVRCTCQTIFLALLEFRRDKRRRVNLKGTYRTYRQYVDREGKMLISDISRGGLLCQVSDSKGLEEGQILILDYRLDDIGKRKINKRAVIRHKHGMSVGCEFMQL